MDEAGNVYPEKLRAVLTQAKVGQKTLDAIDGCTSLRKGDVCHTAEAICECLIATEQ